MGWKRARAYATNWPGKDGTGPRTRLYAKMGEITNCSAALSFSSVCARALRTKGRESTYGHQISRRDQ